MNRTRAAAVTGQRRVTILSSVHLALDNRVFYREARTLAGAGYAVTLIAVHDHDEVRDGITIRALPQVPRWRRPLLWRRLLGMAMTTQADIYHFHDPELLLVSPFLRLRTGRPTVYDIHEVYPEFVEVKDYLPGWLRRPLAGLTRVVEPALARHESGLIFADDQIAAAFEGANKPKVIVPNFPDLAQLSGSEAAPLPDAPNKTILYLGGMERNRGAGLMLTAFHQVLQTVPDARLLLVGHFAPPELEQEIRRRAHELGIEAAVNIIGRVPYEAVPGYLRQASIGWVPWQAARKNELNVPTKLFEYMSAGLPVVASDLASIRPFVEPGRSGLLVRPDDSQAHANALVCLLAQPDKAASLGHRGLELVQTRFNWEAVAPRLLALYDQLLSQSAPVD